MVSPLEKIQERYKPKSPSGLRSLVRQGVIKSVEALSRLNKMARDSGYRSTEMASWLKRQSRSSKNG